MCAPSLHPYLRSNLLQRRAPPTTTSKTLMRSKRLSSREMRKAGSVVESSSEEKEEEIMVTSVEKPKHPAPPSEEVAWKDPTITDEKLDELVKAKMLPPQPISSF